MGKKAKEPEKPSTAWQGTYGDMITLMLCFFVMLYNVTVGILLPRFPSASSWVVSSIFLIELLIVLARIMMIIIQMITISVRIEYKIGR